MKVSKLIKKLSQLDPNAIVVMSSDGEGNQFSPLADLDVGKYIPETTWSGHVPAPEDLADEEYYEREEVENMQDCVILWPTN